MRAKFKVWNEQWEVWERNARMDNNGDLYLLNDDGEEVEDVDYNRLKVVFWTGLKDKNGVEIYEGDIDDESIVIKWNNTFSAFFYGDCYLGSINPSNINIIGNIYENPELLTQTK